MANHSKRTRITNSASRSTEPEERRPIWPIWALLARVLGQVEVIIHNTPGGSLESRSATEIAKLVYQIEELIKGPIHLRDDVVLATCTNCLRKSWSMSEFEKTCNMPQPDGTRCSGKLLPNFPRSSQNQTVSSGVEGAHEGTTADKSGTQLPKEK